MRYNIRGGIIIRSENAAKPASLRSQFLLDIMNNLPPVVNSFDYGCGKLRYLDAIARTSDAVAIVDSEIQLSRRQKLKSELTSIREIVRNSNRVRAFNDIEFTRLDERFDRAFCINVLSVIPVFAARRQVLGLIHSKLKPGGSCVFVVQIAIPISPE